MEFPWRSVMKNLQDSIKEVSQYFRGLDVYNDAIMVKVEFPKKWNIYDSEDGKIKAAPSETGDNLIYYYGNCHEITYEDIFSLLEDTIQNNENLAKKIELLKTKGEELKELFSSLSYEELLTLKFTFDKKAKPKRKYTRRKKDNNVSINENNDDERIEAQ